jgi:hypothetical protein
VRPQMASGFCATAQLVYIAGSGACDVSVPMTRHHACGTLLPCRYTVLHQVEDCFPAWCRVRNYLLQTEM